MQAHVEGQQLLSCPALQIEAWARRGGQFGAEYGSVGGCMKFVCDVYVCVVWSCERGG